MVVVFRLTYGSQQVAKESSIFTSDWRSLRATAIDLDHLCVFVPWLHKMAEPTIKRSSEILKTKYSLPDSFGPGTACGIVNLFHKGNYRQRAPVGSRISGGKEVFQIAEEVCGRMYCEVLVVLHESFEVFVRNLYAKMLFDQKETLSPPRRAGFHKSNAKWRSYHKTLRYFEDYAAWASRLDCSEALYFLKENTNWGEIHDTKWGGAFEWIRFIDLVAFCRHCIVHNEGRVAESRWKKFNSTEAKFLRRLMKNSTFDKRERILPTARVAKSIIEGVLSLAYAIYILVSRRCDQSPDDILF